MVAKTVDNDLNLARAHAVVDKLDSQHHVIITLYRLCHCLYRRVRLHELVFEIDERIFLVLDQKPRLGLNLQVLAGLEVGEPRVSDLLLGLEVLEVPFALVKLPELLLRASSDQQLLFVEFRFLALLFFEEQIFETV